MNQDSFIQRLWHRRIPQILGAYVMAGVAVVGFVGLLVERYKLADRVFDAALLAFFTMIPAILLLAYTHGAPGKQAWGRLERFGIPINVAITLVLVVGVLLTETRVEALTETVEVVNVDGSIEEKLRPRAEKRRELAMFFWRNDSGDESLEWLRYGFPILLRRDLEQNPFFDTNSAFSFTTELERADIADALDVPIALAQRISRDHGITYFTDGSFAREGDDWRANLVLYLTETAEPVVTLDATGPTYVEVVDELSIAVRKALDVVDIEELGRDLPVTEHTSVEAIAIEQWIRGNVAQWRDNQAQTAIDSFQKAIEIDPTFALAYSDLAATYSSLGKNTEAIEAASSARKHDYRLNERERLILPIFELVATGHYKKLILVHEQITTLFPTDVSAWRGLAHTYELFGEPVQAIEAYQHVLELDPSEHEVQLEIGRLQSQLGNYEEARQAYQHYVEARPDDASGHMALATTSWFEGDLEETRATFEQARLLTSNPINVDILLAELDGAQGNLEAAERRLNDLSIRVTVPMDRLTVENARIQHYSYLGRYQKGLALSAELHEVLLAVGLPFVADLSVLNYEASTLGVLGRVDEARTKIERLATSGHEPFASYAQLAYLLLGMVTEDSELLRTKVVAVEELAQQIEEPLWPLMILHGKALLAELDGDPATAVQLYAESEAMLRASIMGGNRLMYVSTLRPWARAAIDAGKLDVAAGCLERLLMMYPASPVGNFEAARLAVVRKDLASARKHLDITLEMWRDADPGVKAVVEARKLDEQLREREATRSIVGSG